MNTHKTITIENLMRSPFYSGGLKVNISQNIVEYQQEVLVLQPKVLELLVILCAGQGETLSKQTLTSALWPDTIVGPDSLANAITRLRKALNDDAKNPQFIETVQRKGYRWLQETTITNNKRSKIKATYLSIALVIAAPFIWIATKNQSVQIIKPLFPETTHMGETKGSANFPFPDLHIERLDEGGYEIQVGIEGELTEEKKAAMLKEIKRITGEEHSGMIFTVDPIQPSCNQEALSPLKENKEQSCTKKKH